MTIVEAIEIVENFNKWRIGESNTIAKPSQITEAIDVLLEVCNGLQIADKKFETLTKLT